VGVRVWIVWYMDAQTAARFDGWWGPVSHCVYFIAIVRLLRCSFDCALDVSSPVLLYLYRPLVQGVIKCTLLLSKPGCYLLACIQRGRTLSTASWETVSVSLSVSSIFDCWGFPCRAVQLLLTRLIAIVSKYHGMPTDVILVQSTIIISLRCCMLWSKKLTFVKKLNFAVLATESELRVNSRIFPVKSLFSAINFA